MSEQGREAGRALFLASKICAVIGALPLLVAWALDALGLHVGNAVGLGILAFVLWFAAAVLLAAALLCDPS